jgi:Na+-translocating ferredoxin:NAD+ oxidoreductase subunit D
MIKSSSPHLKGPMTSQRIMILVLIALMPSVFASFYYFKFHAFKIFIVTMLSTFVFDLLFQRITYPEKKINYFYASSYVTTVLLYMILPPTVPLWIPIIGVIVSLGIGKYVFGYGNSIFNPALVGRSFLAISWPAIMTTWIVSDTITSATPLAIFTDPDKGLSFLINQYGSEIWLYYNMFIGHILGSLGETSKFTLLLGGLFLIYMKIIDWRIPTIYIGGVALLMFFYGENPLFHVLSGGLILGAFFMATDYGTIPITKKGRIIFALGCAILTVIFRIYSSMPDGVMYSILLMNASSPIIERFTKTKPFGYIKLKKKI